MLFSFKYSYCWFSFGLWVLVIASGALINSSLYTLRIENLTIQRDCSVFGYLDLIKRQSKGIAVFTVNILCCECVSIGTTCYCSDLENEFIYISFA